MPAQAGLGLAEAQGRRGAKEGHAVGQGSQGQRLPGVPARRGGGHPGQSQVHGPKNNTADKQRSQMPVLQGLAPLAVLAVASSQATPVLHSPRQIAMAC